MALITRQNNYGVDKRVDDFQRLLYNRLSGQFGSWECYPRVYKNKIHRNETTVIIAQHEQNNQYVDVLFNDRVNMQSFFIKDDDRTPLKGNLSATTSMSLIMQCNLDAIYPNEQNRTDEKLKRDIINVSSLYGDWELTSVVDGLENVYKEFYNDDLRWDNIEPRHVVRFNYDLLYNYENCGV